MPKRLRRRLAGRGPTCCRARAGRLFLPSSRQPANGTRRTPGIRSFARALLLIPALGALRRRSVPPTVRCGIRILLVERYGSASGGRHSNTARRRSRSGGVLHREGFETEVLGPSSFRARSKTVSQGHSDPSDRLANAVPKIHGAAQARATCRDHFRPVAVTIGPAGASLGGPIAPVIAGRDLLTRSDRARGLRPSATRFAQQSPHRLRAKQAMRAQRRRSLRRSQRARDVRGHLSPRAICTLRMGAHFARRYVSQTLPVAPRSRHPRAC